MCCSPYRLYSVALLDDLKKQWSIATNLLQVSHNTCDSGAFVHNFSDNKHPSGCIELQQLKEKVARRKTRQVEMVQRWGL